MARKTCLAELMVQEALKKAKATGKPVIITTYNMDTEAPFDFEAAAKRVGINLPPKKK